MSQINNIGFGCAGLSAQKSLSAAMGLLDTAFNSGIRHFDTAPIYGNGYSEKILGKFIRNKRDQVTITSKFGLVPALVPQIPLMLALPLNFTKKMLRSDKKVLMTISKPVKLDKREITLNEVRSNFESSLRNLKTNYIDIYLLHEGLPGFLSSEALQYIFGLKIKGDVSKIGIASSYVNLYNFTEDELAEWNILQYENGMNHQSDDLLFRFPSKMHIYHSALASLKLIDKNKGDPRQLAGMLLAKAAKQNPHGKILFSTSKSRTLKANLLNYNTFQNYDLTTLDKLITGAIH